MDLLLSKIDLIIHLRKMKYWIFVLSLLFGIHSNCNAQQVSCDDLIDFIEMNGYYTSSIGSYTLDSSWLYKVTAYTYQYKTFVIAEIKKNEYSYVTNTYIFCGIPSSNWSNFQYSGYYDSDSYGERFHKYIMDYKCNCY
ncbi:hypothetical protein [Aquimarina sp. AU474]|uniref:hypothetical protein n=1 Tax=Aquimarina sp. AU474 TaxID=2108529 RepID=UPI000D686B0F|nr:hypothetical protein [Aquimarina sp. AU474]